MGLSTKQVSGDHQGLLIDWGGGQTMLPSSSNAAELSKPPPVKRHQPPPQQQSEPPLKCPRCASTNTKFCYYNNYNKSQPRHFCKSCKRHWTKGGTLRNVPVGGGRKNKRPKISNSSTTTTAASSAAAGARRQEDKANNIGDDHKSMSRFLYQSSSSSPLLHETRDCINIIGINNGGANSTISTGLMNMSSVSDHKNNQNTEFHEFTGLSTFDHMNASLGPTCNYQSLNVFDNYNGNLDPMEESTITTVNDIPSSSSSALWPVQNTTTSSLELPNYWNWNEIDDVLTSSDHLNISWDDHDHDDAEIKP